MRKVIVLAATVAALAACAKNEVVPVGTSAKDEITFNVAPKTKAVTDFGHDLKFKSYAYYNDPDETVAPQLYISDETISYVEDGDAWKAATPYYWPKKEGSSLTFYAWTSLKESNAGTAEVKYTYDAITGTRGAVSCSADNGIEVKDFDITKNTNIDVLVADSSAVQTHNKTTYSHNGVPTLFKHKLSYVVFTVKTDKSYRVLDGNLSKPGDKIFTLQSITFKGLKYKGAYTQLSDEKWEADEASTDQVYFNQPTVGQTISDSQTTLTSDLTLNYYLPQKFTNAQYFEIVYTIKTQVTGTKSVTETVTRNVYLNPDKSDAAEAEPVKPFADGKWEIGKKYTVNLTFSLDEITWDPAVEDWTNVDAGDVTIQ